MILFIHTSTLVYLHLGGVAGGGGEKVEFQVVVPGIESLTRKPPIIIFSMNDPLKSIVGS